MEIADANSHLSTLEGDGVNKSNRPLDVYVASSVINETVVAIPEGNRTHFSALKLAPNASALELVSFWLKTLSVYSVGHHVFHSSGRVFGSSRVSIPAVIQSTLITSTRLYPIKKVLVCVYFFPPLCPQGRK